MSTVSGLVRLAGFALASFLAQSAFAQVPTCNTPLTTAQRGKVKFVPGHYVAVGSSKDSATWYKNTLKEISDSSLRGQIIGIQKRYYWSDLQPYPTTYRLKPILDDIALAKNAKKRLSVMIMFKYRNDFDLSAVPGHIKSIDPERASGAMQEPWYKVNGDGNRPNSEIANFGHPDVRDRFLLFLKELAKAVDNDDTVTSVVLPESAMSIVPGAAPYEKMTGAMFSPIKEAHAEGLRYIDQVASCLFKHTPVIPLTNYPEYALKDFYETFEKFNLGLGGPDIWTDDDEIEASYSYVRSLKNKLPVGFIVAGGNYKYVSRTGEEEEHKAGGNPVPYMHRTVEKWSIEDEGKKTVQKLLDKAQTLGVNYLFWKKNGGTGDKFWLALKSEVAAGRIDWLDNICPYNYTPASGFAAGCVKSLSD